MISFIFIGLLGLLGYFLSSKIEKVKYILYGIFTLLGVVSIVLKSLPIFTPINQGFLGLSFFYVVMITGLFKHDSAIYKRLYSVRSIYSILGFIVLTPHAVIYLIEKFANNGPIDLFGVIAYLIMIPLFITSFQKVDNPQKMFKWKKLQRFAYLAYLLIFVHLIIVAKMPNTIVYLVLFIPYFIYKPVHFIKHEMPIYRAMQKKLNQKEKE
jgi:DMSO/TMAO reductase YedYZ heme-binding membrane subunit